ncbi:MAG: NADH-quinone oxidoreductase subunit M [Candidatus Bathyarchaeota archaeon]|nr:NADH-quinone oxidoreductase subunit M [Candidatus Bathyarchaeota archaeon]
MMLTPLWIAILAPILFMPIVYAIGRRIGKKVSWIALIPLAFSVVTFINFMPTISLGPIGEYFFWLPELRFGLLLDGLSLPIVLTVAILSALIVIYSTAYMEHKVHEEYHEDNKKAYATYYALYLAYATSMMGVALSTNLFEFYFFFELMIIPSWALINIYGYGEREKIALTYLLWSIVGAVLFVTGALTAHAVLHSFEISDLAKLNGHPLSTFIVISMLLGFFIKMAAFGLHIWLPYAHTEAPTPISALLSPAMIGLAAYATVRILVPIQSAFQSIHWIVLIWAFVTMVYGGLMVLAQTDIKRLLAYSSMSQMGYLIIGIASNTPLGISGTMLHYVSHGLGKAALFLSAGAIMHQSGIRDIRSLGGLAGKMPISAVAFTIGVMNIAGIPPTIGFISKMMVFMGAINRGLVTSPLDLAVTFAALISTALTIGYTTWTIRRIFFGPTPEHLNNVKEAPITMTAPLIIISVLSVVLGIYPKFILDPLIQIVQVLVPG